MTLTAAAHCHRCGPLAEGDPATVDKAADKHTAAGHPTATVTTPQPKGNS